METEALQRSLTVFEILGNLHCHSEQVENPQMEGHFARLLHAEVLNRDKAGASPHYERMAFSTYAKRILHQVYVYSPVHQDA